MAHIHSQNCDGSFSARIIRVHREYLKLKKVGITGSIVAACARDDPGLGEAIGASSQTAVGGVVLLDVFPVSLSAQSTGLSSHPVWNGNLSADGSRRWQGFLSRDATAEGLAALPAIYSGRGRPCSNRAWRRTVQCLAPAVRFEWFLKLKKPELVSVHPLFMKIMSIINTMVVFRKDI